jgi:hypothetical protein
MTTIATRRRLSFDREPATKFVVVKILLVVGALLFLGGMALSGYYNSVASEATWMIGKMPALRPS